MYYSKCESLWFRIAEAEGDHCACSLSGSPKLRTMTTVLWLLGPPDFKANFVQTSLTALFQLHLLQLIKPYYNHVSWIQTWFTRIAHVTKRFLMCTSCAFHNSFKLNMLSITSGGFRKCNGGHVIESLFLLNIYYKFLHTYWIQDLHIHMYYL